MPRRKISEYRSKVIVSEALDIPYVGWSVGPDTKSLASIKGFDRYVVKVDQAVKGRFKKGLVLLDIQKKDLKAAIKQLQDKGYEHLIIEPQMAHDQSQERYLSMLRDREGLKCSVSASGGVDIEAHPESIETFVINEKTKWNVLSEKSGLTRVQLETIVATFTKNYFAFLEINPYVIEGEILHLLDCAVEVDDAADYFVNTWSEKDFRTARTKSYPEEQAIRALDDNSPASFTLEVINPDGAVFLLLSGGGASVVIADEVNNHGLGDQLANYGEYSGNPNTEEAYLYTKEVLSVLVKSKAERKVLFIGGAVANFTDIANTFAGVIMAIDDYAKQLAKQGVKIYVRRGGPRQEIGLEKIRLALAKHGLLGGVYDPSTSIADALESALMEVRS